MTTPRKKGKPGRVKKWFIGQLKSVLEIAKGLWPTKNKSSLEWYFTRRTSGEKLVSLGLVSGCRNHKWHVRFSGKLGERIDAGRDAAAHRHRSQGCWEVGKPVEAIKDGVRFQGELQAETRA